MFICLNINSMSNVWVEFVKISAKLTTLASKYYDNRISSEIIHKNGSLELTRLLNYLRPD